MVELMSSCFLFGILNNYSVDFKVHSQIFFSLV